MPNISRGKGNQTLRFGQLIECNMWNNFLEKSYAKCGGETSSKLFSKKLKLSISLEHSMKFHTAFLLYAQVEGCQNILKLSYGPLAFTAY